MDLAHKLILAQFDAVFQTYVEWFEVDEHLALKPRDPNITFGTEVERRRLVYKFAVNVNGQTVTFFSNCQSQSWTNSYIDLGGRIATYGELADILGDITTEMHHQLTQYAINNNFPPENIRH